MLENGKINVTVYPAFVPNDSQLSLVDDVFNAIMINGDATGEVMFYGRGAGKLPTASAVVADVIDCVKHVKARKYLYWANTEEDYVVDDMFRNCGMLHTIYLNNCNAFTIDQIIQELPNTRYELGLGKGTIYCKKANLIDEGKEINNSTPPSGWKYEFVDID